MKLEEDNKRIEEAVRDAEHFSFGRKYVYISLK